MMIRVIFSLTFCFPSLEPISTKQWEFFLFCFLSSTFVGSKWSFGFFIPATTANDIRLQRIFSIFYPRFYSLHLFSCLNFWERASIFPFECSTILITSLVWRGPWLGIEPGTSRTRCKHSTTRLSRRQYTPSIICLSFRFDRVWFRFIAMTTNVRFCIWSKYVGKIPIPLDTQWSVLVVLE